MSSACSTACSIQFLFKDIAEWLHPSQFYRLLIQLSHDAEEDDLINVPYYVSSLHIQRGEEEPLKRVLQTCRYWGLELQDWPDELCHILWGKDIGTERKRLLTNSIPRCTLETTWKRSPATVIYEHYNMRMNMVVLGMKIHVAWQQGMVS